MFRKYLLPYIVYIVYRLWSATWRVTIVESPEMIRRLNAREPVVLAFWHGDELVMVSLTRRYRAATMTSTSKDGELMNKVLNLLGMKTSRGSSTRGAVQALKGLIRLAREGCVPSIAVDGPKGPYHVIKPGVFEVSRMADAPMVACGIACSRAIRFHKSWNKTYFPLPFARVVIVWSDCLGPVTREQDAHSHELTQTLAKAFSAAEQEALKIFSQN